ncbi:MAG: glycoside hydrolase family 15 protein [Euzebya sp.]
MGSGEAPLDPPGSAYPPIGDYALLADCHSSALVSRSGSVDWACLTRFDGSAAFARLLDWAEGGHCSISPTAEVVAVDRCYRGDSLVLDTTIRTEAGTLVITDAFAMRSGGQSDPRNQLIRMATVTDGSVEIQVQIVPRFDYGELRPWIRWNPTRDCWTAVAGHSALVISGPTTLEKVDHSLHATMTLGSGDRLGLSVVATRPENAADTDGESIDAIAEHLEETVAWWGEWAEEMTVEEGAHSGMVRRSAVVLKGLTCAPTGAIIAAPTTSLPEHIGGERNWDYRYSWIRDSSLAIAAMTLVGHEEVATGFRQFILRTTSGDPEDLQIMYGVDGRRSMPELELDREGYRGSRPVRIGNGAAGQVQHDMYGHLLEAATFWRDGADMDDDEWCFLASLADRACAVWDQPDRGIWEIRGEPRHFTQSKVMLWVALDRAIALGKEFDEPAGSDIERWHRTRDLLRKQIHAKGVRNGAFVQRFDADVVDAALLTLPQVGFVAPDDPIFAATVDRIMAELTMGEEGFIRRYLTADRHDGLAGEEGTFLICSFWLVEALAGLGRMDQAEQTFQRLLDVANDVGLFAEQYDPDAGVMLGNFPQAFTHMSVITTAATLERCRAEGPKGSIRSTDRPSPRSA